MGNLDVSYKFERNYKSDFSLVLRLRDESGEEVLSPWFDWTAKFYTSASKAITYVAKCHSRVLTNARIDNDGLLHIIFDNHGLPAGKLMVEFTVENPDSEYPDGSQRSVSPMELNMELVKRHVCVGEAEVELTLPILIRTAEGLEATELGKILDRINAKMEEILGIGSGEDVPGGASAKLKSVEAPVLQRGIISVYAKPGVVYRNLRWIRIPVKKGIETVVDLSGVDLECVEDIMIPGVGGDVAVRYIELDREARTARILLPDTSETTCVRLRLKQECETKKYIMRGTDGIIKPVGFAVAPVERMPQAPTVKRRIVQYVGTLADLCDTLFDGVEVEVKRNPGHKKPPRWKKVREGSVSSKAKQLGVARVRYPKSGRRCASAWSVFSFRRIGENPEEHMLVVPL